jgi:7-cyano-7-deazaguanine synthase
VKEHRVIEIPGLRELGDIERKELLRGLPATYIPLRNLIFYGLAASYAEEVGASYIVGGHNREDLAVFEDTGSQFFANLEKTVRSASKRLTERNLTIRRPLQRKTKVEVISLAATLGVPFELTWSCYREGRKHCWRCEGCRKRIDVFKRAGVKDPLRDAYFQTNI